MKKYWCDYCETHVENHPIIRKKHNEGLRHQKNKLAHYQNYKTLEEIIEEEKLKKPCSRMEDKAECSFGAMCRYSHYDIDYLKYLVEQG